MPKISQNKRRQHKRVLGHFTKAEVDELLCKVEKLREVVRKQFEPVTTITKAELDLIIR